MRLSIHDTPTLILVLLTAVAVGWVLGLMAGRHERPATVVQADGGMR